MLGSFAGRYGLSLEQAARLGCAFGGGIARTGQLCGAVGGALLVLGLAHGARTAEDQAGRERCYAVTRDFLSRFQERQGSLVCRDLLGVDIGTPEGRSAAVRDGLFKSTCPSAVAAAAELLAELV